MHDQVRQQLRTQLGRDEQSTVAIADSQSVMTTEKKGKSTVSMVARRLKGAPRHIVVDSQGLLIGVLVTEANASERLGAVVVLDEAKEKLCKLEVIWVDQGYSGKNFANAVEQVCCHRVRVEVIERISKTFEHLPKR